MKFWELTLFSQIVMFGVSLWAYLGWTYFYPKAQSSSSLIASSASVVLGLVFILSGRILLTTWPLAPILFLLSSRIDPIPWL